MGRKRKNTVEKPELAENVKTVEKKSFSGDQTLVNLGPAVINYLSSETGKYQDANVGETFKPKKIESLQHLIDAGFCKFLENDSISEDEQADIDDDEEDILPEEDSED